MRTLQTVVLTCAALTFALTSGCERRSGDTHGLTVIPNEWTVFAGGEPKQFTAALTGSGDPIVWSSEAVVTATAGALSDFATIAVAPTVLQVTGPASVDAGGAPVEFTITTAVGERGHLVGRAR